MRLCFSAVFQLVRTRFPEKVLVRRLSNATHHQTLPHPHLYKKSYTVSQLIQYLKENVVYEDSKIIVTSVPQGIGFRKDNIYTDYEKPPICNFGMQEIIDDFKEAFKTKSIYVAKYPRRSSSGLTILAKDFRAFQQVRSSMARKILKNQRMLFYLAVVLGTPKETLLHTYHVKLVGDEKIRSIKIYNSLNKPNSPMLAVKYKHEVLQSSEGVSLLTISVSCDKKDCIRHILIQECCTPLLGDFWGVNKVRNTLFGVPILGEIPKNNTYFDLNPEILTKLQLSPGDENSIPILSHFYGISLKSKNNVELFISTPPPESFVWTCNQLGLTEINKFLKPVVLKK